MDFNRSTFVAIMLVGGCVGPAIGQTCPAGSQRVAGGNNALATFLTGKTVCVGSGPNWNSQEFHAANFDLIDWKRGAGHPTDPTGKVGTWSATNGGQATVTYVYGSNSYTFALCAVPTEQNPSSYTFAGPSTVTGAQIKSGQVPC